MKLGTLTSRDLMSSQRCTPQVTPVSNTKSAGFKMTLLYLLLYAHLPSNVYGSVTNGNGFRIGLLDLLTPSFTINLNRNQLQQRTMNVCVRLTPFLFLLSLSLTD